MTIHAFAGEKASRTHENQMLQRFLEQIEERWMQSTDWIYVIANAMWEGSEVDLVCMLPSMIFVADFKNYQGRISGTENGPWLADSIPIKGGAQKNPFVQLRKNRFSIMDWLGKRVHLEGRNLGHLSAGVIFSGPILNELDISQRSKSWFHVIDIDGSVKTLDALASPQLTLRQEEADQIVQLLGVTPHVWQSSRPAVVNLGATTTSARLHPLTEHQQEALTAITQFLQSGDHCSMSVVGMTSTGKTHLLMEAVEAIERQGRKAIPLVPNSRLVGITSHGLQCTSVYRHLYLQTGDNGSTGQKRVEAAPTHASDSMALKATKGDSTPRKKSSAAKVIPLRECIDPDTCVYLVDDAHLLGDNFFVTSDGKQYGSGCLLTDLFAFGNFAHTGRQIIFFADPYQIQRAAPTDSVVDGSFQSRNDLVHVTFPLEQVVDVSHGGALLQNATSLVNAMRAEKFASLSVVEDESVRIVDNKTAARELAEHFCSNPFSTWYLVDTNAKVTNFTRWLRRKILGKPLPGSLEEGDLLEVASIWTADAQDVGSTGQIHPGERYCVEEVGRSQDISQPLSGRPKPITFRLFDHVTLKGPGILAMEKSGSLGRLLENYLTEEKPELPADTAVAVRVWANKRKRDGDESTPVTGSDRDATGKADEEVGVSGVSLARYGYGATVHHAQGMSQPFCYVNADHAAGRHTEAYFRWLYTALTTVGQTLTLFNYAPIHPFDSANWNLRAAEQSTEISIGAGWRFSPVTSIDPQDEQRAPAGLDASKVLQKSIAVWLRVDDALLGTGWHVSKVHCSPYREKYELQGPQDVVWLAVAYDGKCVVKSMHIGNEAHWPLLGAIAERCVEQNDFTPNARALLDALRELIARADWKLVSAVETNWRLNVTIARNLDERLWLEINFDKQGLATTIRLLKFSKSELLDELQGLIK